MWGNPNKADEEHEKGDRYTLEEAWNQRLLVRPIEYIPDMPLRDTRGDAIKVNVVNLDTGVLYRGCLWFSGPIIKAFKKEIGTPFIGYPTKEPMPNSVYKRWVFMTLVGDPDTEARAQAYINANPEFMAPIEQRPAQTWGATDTSHHENGPAPAWAGPVPPDPMRAGPVRPDPTAPPRPPVPPQRPPAPPVGYPVSAPPAPPAPPQPAAAPVSGAPGGESMMDRLRRQAEQPFPLSSGRQAANEEAPF